MTSQTYQTDDGQLMQDHDQVVLESHLTEPEADLAVAEPDLTEPDADPMSGWLASLANQLGLSLEDAARRYADGCPKCTTTPCSCARLVG